ncbi:cytochrome c oxidase subunit I [Marinobacter sp.]|uniref:cytochrome c oxidase subunit I n=1 Tax=Marinobacter sp. TaxID=50741 RepID=UPI0034A4EBE7
MSSASDQSNHERERQLAGVWDNLPGWGTLVAVNHTSVGLRFMATGMLFFLVGGLLAMLIRTQLALPEQTIVEAGLYSQLFTMHGTVMMFLFAIPVLEGAAMYLIPKMIGTRDLVFPRLSALGYYCYVFGGLIVLSSLVLEIAPDSGWFMYTPLSSSDYSPGPGSDFWLLGITFVEISAISAGIELVVSILRTRAPGMSLNKMPIFCWYILAMALMIVFGFPPLILGSILLELERAAGMVFFDTTGGGDPLLWQHLFWLFGHPEVYIIFLPAAGIVSTLIPVFARRPLVGYHWIVLAIITMGFVSFGLWVHHMFTVGIPHLAQAFFSIASMLVAVPTAIQIFAWLATLWQGRVVFGLPMLWIVGFLVVFVCGGLTGVMLALVPFNWQVHDTHFVVAHLHYVLVGGMLFPLVAGFYYWLPHVSGRMPSYRRGRWGFWLFFGGFNLTFLLMHLTGLLGMPRRVYTYEAGLGWDWLNLLSSVGSFVMAIGVAVIIIDIFLHFRFGEKASQNPWGADTLEWAIPMPVNSYNFSSMPEVSGRHPLWDTPRLPERISKGEFGLAHANNGRREIYLSDAITGKVTALIHLPTNSWLPMLTAGALAVVCLALLLKIYLAALVAAAVALMVVLRWGWENGGHPKISTVGEDNPDDPPVHSRTLDGPGLWGMNVTLMSNGTLYVSLIFGWFYLWTAAPQWATPDKAPVSISLLTGSGLLLTVAVGIYHKAVSRLREGNDSGLNQHLWVAAGVAGLHWAMLILAIVNSGLQPRALAHDAVITVALVYLAVHSGLAIVMTALQAVRAGMGYVGKALPYEPVVVRPFWIYTLGVFWLTVAAFFLIPLAWSVP